MPIRFALLFFLLAGSQAEAAALYKCTGPKKDAVSIQSAPCPTGSKQVWVRDGTPEPAPTDAQLRTREEKRQQDAEATQSLSRMAGTGPASNTRVYQNQSNADQSIRRCNSAKEQAKAVRDRDWRTLTIDRLRQLDAWVAAECKAK